MIAALGLQKALFDLLANDSALIALLDGAKVFDTPPSRAQFPYIAFGPLSAVDWSTSEDLGSAYIVTLNCWSQMPGRKQVLTIADRVSAVLDQSPILTLDENTKVVLVHQVSMSVENDVATKAIRATLRYRVLVEPTQ